MTMISVTGVADARPPFPKPRTPLHRVLFGDLASATMTIGVIAFFVSILPALDWAVFDAVWDTSNPSECRTGGACWAFIADKIRFILFGIYPPPEQWRPASAVAIILAMILVSLPPRLWGRGLMAAWAAAIAVVLVLMWGGFFGLTFVSTQSWGGLPVTLLLSALSLGFGFPLAVLLALGRRSSAPVSRLLSVLTVEIVRGVPLVGLLFVAAILLPLLLPETWAIDKLGRTLAALTIFAAAYLAEVIRGGLQGVHHGQVEAARALGIPHWKSIWYIVLPQAIQKVIPPLTNTAIVMVKNTSLVLIVGVFDMLSAGRAAAADARWPAPHAESYIFVAMIYFVLCFGISLYTRWLENNVQERNR